MGLMPGFPPTFDRSRGIMTGPRQSQAESPLTRNHFPEKVWDNVPGEFRTAAPCPCGHGDRQVNIQGTWRYTCCGEV